jgi:hypothetical protein
MLSVIMLSFVKPSVVMLSAVTPNVAYNTFMLNVIMLSVVAPYDTLYSHNQFCSAASYRVCYSQLLPPLSNIFNDL